MGNSSKLPILSPNQIDSLFDTISYPRFTKYLKAASSQKQKAIRLYVINTKISGAFMADLHFLEIALRNKFTQQLSKTYGNDWFNNLRFTQLLNPGSQRILHKAIKKASRTLPPGTSLSLLPGKVVSELSFGFWHMMLESKLEHKLWIPCLHKAFLPRKPPKRSDFNQNLEKLRQLRNRIAHHEPIFHQDLANLEKLIFEITHTICPETAFLMKKTSSVKRHIMGLNKFTKLCLSLNACLKT